ncbi:MAG: flavodoxin family protein [Spirochaetota bacterium]
MRVAVVFVPQAKREKLIEISKALASGIESQGHRVDLVDASRDVNTKLTIYEYVAIGTEVVSMFGGKIPEKVSEFLNSSGIVSGKRSFAFVTKKAIGADKGLQRLMKKMESQGMFLKFSDVLSSPAEATEIGKRLKIN